MHVSRLLKQSLARLRAGRGRRRPVHCRHAESGRVGVRAMLTDEEVAQVLVFGEIALPAVLDGQKDAPVGSVPEGLGEPPVFRAEISQAQGMIMIQLGVTIAEALVSNRPKERSLKHTASASTTHSR